MDHQSSTSATCWSGTKLPSDLRRCECPSYRQGQSACAGHAGDATIIDAPVFDAEQVQRVVTLKCPSTKKGNDWYFGMKAHIGVDAGQRRDPQLETSTRQAPTTSGLDDLLHGDETSVWADKG